MFRVINDELWIVSARCNFSRQHGATENEEDNDLIHDLISIQIRIVFIHEIIKSCNLQTFKELLNQNSV